MEAVLVQDENSLSDMISSLTRSRVLLEDLQAHLDELLDTANALPSGLDNTVEEGSEKIHEEIDGLTHAAQELLASRSLLDAPRLTRDHIALLTTRQARAVLRYIDRLSACSRGSFTPTQTTVRYDEGVSSMITTSSASSSSSTSGACDNGLILAHAYVRYMGDLSGGQHIVKRLAKLFPIYQKSKKGQSTPGFQFYSFTSTNKTSTELKDMIRNRMDSADFQEEEVVQIVDEASEAFRLNRGLLDSLVDEEDLEEEEDAEKGPNSTHQVIRPSRLSSVTLLSPLLSFHPHNLAFIATLFALGTALTLHTIL
jgi:hypothetical protein